MRPVEFFIRTRAFVLQLSAWLAWLPALLTRLVLFAVFAPAGWGKIHSLERVTAYFTDLGVPLPHVNAGLVAVTELVGGVLLLVGLGARLAAMPLIATMVVAIGTAKRDKIGGILDLLSLEEFIYIVLLVWICIAGAGLVSADGLIARRLARRTTPDQPVST